MSELPAPVQEVSMMEYPRSEENEVSARRRLSSLARWRVVGLFILVGCGSGGEGPTGPGSRAFTVSVSPATLSLERGQTTELAAVVRDGRTGTVTGVPVTWTTTDPGVVRVDSVATDAPGESRARITGVRRGAARIVVRAGGSAAVSWVTVDMAVLAGAGDIAACDSQGDEATAALLDELPGTIFTAGDNVYPSGRAREFANCYDPSWGRHKGRTRPSPGNHDYLTPDASAYFAYFGEQAGDPREGYYRYNLGAWHIVAINSNIAVDAGSPQLEWLRQDLAANPAVCTAAYWHHARFSSGQHGNDPRFKPLWEVLYDGGVDVVLVGHDHDYERFAPQTPDGAPDRQRGIRQFVVGTGGRSLTGFGGAARNSEVRISENFGVLKLTLFPASYGWEFIPVAGGTFMDSGSDVCH